MTEEPEPSDGIDLPKVALPPEDPEVAHADELRRITEYWDSQLDDAWQHVFSEPRPVKA